MATVRRRSRVETELPANLRQEANRLILEGLTYEDLATWSASRGFDISRSSWGRYGKEFYEAYQAVKRFEDQSRALTGEAGDGLTMEEAVSKLLMQKVMAAITSGDFDILEIPRLLGDVAKLQSSSIQREKLKDEFSRRARETADKVGKIASRGGLTAETVDQIRSEILGIAK
ncbi:MAG: phage protein Gp27 family protein [Desulfuromonadales bacterium]|nr:phage protein Gp27 family protein [Desulfuromonadales bacterium]